MHNETELREKLAEAIWNAGDPNNPKWGELHPKMDKSLKKEIYQMADAALDILRKENVL